MNRERSAPLAMTKDFQARLSANAAAIEQVLSQILENSPIAGETARPDRLMAAMRHGALDGGKRMRPFLLIESATLLGYSGPGVLQAACALELVHCYSLIHDDLPAMDDDDLRRGKPTVHKLFDEATAILAGDSLLSLAFAVMAEPGVHSDGSVRAELVRMLAIAAGPGGMAGGQMLDLSAEAAKVPLREPEIRQLQAMKTGALIQFACEAGAVIAGASTDDRKILAEFGARLGFLFQVTDDILDAESDTQTLGKAAGKDAARNKATLVTAVGIDRAKALRDAEVTLAVQVLESFGERAQILRDALRFACERQH